MITDSWWFTDRTDGYRVRLLTQAEATVRTSLGGEIDGVIDWNVDNEIRSAGNLSVQSLPSNADIDWAKHRIAIDYWLQVGGFPKYYPLGVYIPSAPKVDYGQATQVIDLEFYDKLIILKQDRLRSSKSFAKGSKMTDAVRWVIQSTGEKKIKLDPSTKSFGKNLTYKAGTSKLTMVTEILRDLGYFSIWVDREGWFRCHPYVDPAKRPTVFEFTEGAKGVHSSEWTRDSDGFEVPNRYVCISAPGSKDKSLVSVAEDVTSKWGFKARGRWITTVEENIDETKQSKLDDRAKSSLKRAQAIHDTLNIEHAIIPVDMNEVVSFTSQGYSGRVAFREMRVSLRSGERVKSTLERVN